MPTTEELNEMKNQSDMNLAEDGCSYDTLGLLECRSDRLAEEIAYAEEHGDRWVCLKAPSGSEQSIRLELAKAYHSGSWGGRKRQAGLAPRFQNYRY